MKKTIVFLLVNLSLAAFTAASLANTAPAMLNDEIAHLQAEWARIKYQVADKQDQINAMQSLAEEAASLAETYPKQAQAKIWQGIIVSTEAGMNRGLSALSKLKKAKVLFLAAIEDDATALQGSAYTSLASLYYQVPGWPISFGSSKKARQYFALALKMNPDGIDSNFFYADFLRQQEDYAGAKKHLERALAAKPRVGRALADEGRRQEIRAMLASLDDTENN
jgi:tetratricopeptide (TPR) repeat protein